MRHRLSELGAAIKQIRKSRKMTLQDVADRTGLTAGLLSKVENCRTMPSLPVLMSIAEALDANASDMFKSLEVKSQPSWLLIRSKEQTPLDREESRAGFSYRTIVDMPMAITNCHLMWVSVAPDAGREPFVSDADELYYVLNGRIEVQLETDTVQLEPGDTLLFDGSIPHVPVVLNEEPAELLVTYFFRKDDT